MRGINLVGFLESGLGLGETARLVQLVLEAANIPHCAIPYRRIESDRVLTETANFSDEPIYDTNFFCLNGDQMRPFAQEVGVEFFDGRYNIGLWFWETEKLPREMAVGFDFLDEIWVCSEFVHQAVSAATDLPVRLWPHPVIKPEASGDPSSIDWLDCGDRFVFLFAFDFLSDLRRKNPMATIDAFSQAFPNASDSNPESPMLIIKTIGGEKRPLDLLYLRNFCRRRSSSIRLVDQFLQADEMRALVSRSDCYVSLHRSEGLGQTLLEAMVLGKPCLATAYSGNLQFMNESNSYLCQHGMVPIGKSSYPYPEGDFWADPDVDEAASLMTEIFENREAAKEVGEKGRQTVIEQFSIDESARVFARHLEAIGDRSSRVEAGRLPVATRHSVAYSFLKKELQPDKLAEFRPHGPFRLDYPQMVKMLDRYDRFQNRTHSSILKAVKESEQKQQKEVKRLEGEVNRLTELLYTLVAELEEDSGE